MAYGMGDFYPSFIIFLILILLVFGTGFWGFGGGAYEAGKQVKTLSKAYNGSSEYNSKRIRKR